MRAMHWFENTKGTGRGRSPRCEATAAYFFFFAAFFVAFFAAFFLAAIVLAP
jgi:hypothetical protein